MATPSDANGRSPLDNLSSARFDHRLDRQGACASTPFSAGTLPSSCRRQSDRSRCPLAEWLEFSCWLPQSAPRRYFVCRTLPQDEWSKCPFGKVPVIVGRSFQLLPIDCDSQSGTSLSTLIFSRPNRLRAPRVPVCKSIHFTRSV